MSEANRVGGLGEETAAQYLLTRGYEVRERNYRTKYGEIDIIAQENDTIVFIEVKTRTGSFALPREFVTLAKQKKLRKTAEIYLSQTCLHEHFCRFDVIEVQPDRTGYSVSHIIDAF